jgi:hypothetical protein
MATARAARPKSASGPDHHRRLAAEFEGQRHQIGRRRALYMTPDAGRTGEEQMIKWQGAEGCPDFRPAGNDYSFGGIEILCHPGSQRRRPFAASTQTL